MSKFCHNCGKQMPSVGANFCPFCGTSLSSLSSTPTPPKKPVNKFTPAMVPDEDDDDDYIDKMQSLDIQINRLEIDVVPFVPFVETIGSVRRTALPEGTPVGQDARVGPFVEVDSKKFLAEFQKEAGTMRSKE